MISLPLATLPAPSTVEHNRDDRPREECGIAACYAPGRSFAQRNVYFMLHALQHRGQEAAGISAQAENRIKTHKDVGLVGHVFHEWVLEELSSDRAIGHVRYSTTGNSTPENASPMQFSGTHEVSVAHNGNLVNAARLRAELEETGWQFQTSSDSEVVAAMISTSGTTVRKSIKQAMREMKGAFSLCVLANGRLYGCRDANGIRPLAVGKLETGGYVLASETCALDIINAQYLRDVVPGELIELSSGGLKSWDVLTPQKRGCSLEAIYFARPDSKLGSETIASTRERLGRELAREYPARADAVVPVPNSGRFMALGYAHESGIPMEEALIKNEYVARTFIQPTDYERKRALRMKFNVMPSVVCGKSLVVLDDSLIRGNTMRLIVEMMREAGAAEIHVRIASPPTRWPCHYGIDMGRPGEYIATDAEGIHRSASDVAADLGADSLHYLTPAGLSRAFERPLNQRCTACFTGDYPVLPEDTGKELLQYRDEGGYGGRED